ncbi:MAG: indolepyruvate oxidoreductase subunit beta family protein [Burkholderiales bacterium]
MTQSPAARMTGRPLSILVAALGGEGGGVLADWLRDAALAANLPVQSTSIPGVAQRTGATTYYLEILPRPVASTAARPVFALTPTPGQVDLMVASELVEAGRAMQNGFVSDRTTLIASTHRIYATVEKLPMGDGRYEGERVVEAALQIAGRAVLFDMALAAQRAGTVISAVMFGAIAAALEKSGALPLTRASCEAAIRASGKGVEASLRGFAAGYAAGSGEGAQVQAAAAGTAPAAGNDLSQFPAAARDIVAEGLKRTADYQDARYAALYRERALKIAAQDRGDGTLSAETARYLALWMCFEDVMRVADLKTRRSRFERVRGEVEARAGEPVHIIEFLKPGLDEIAGMLPPSIAPRFHAWATRRGLADRLSIGMHVKTSSIGGFLLLRCMARMRFWRRRTARYAEEQALIERWLAAVEKALGEHPRLAFEIAMTARLIKGYSDTHKRGRANFLRILDNLVDKPAIADPGERAKAIFAAREAALADPEGKNLDQTLNRHGVAPRPLREQPIRFLKPKPRA